MSEWTVEELDGCAVLNRHDGSVPMQFTYVSGIKEITEAHNAALAAEREKHNKELREYESALSGTHLSRIKVLEQQLAAERNENKMMRDQIGKHQQQLAAEREKVQTYEDALIKIANDPYCDRCQVAVDALAKL